MARVCVLEKISHQEFDLNPSKPTHATMNISSDKHSASAVAIHSMLSDDRQVLLGLTFPPRIINTITNIPFTRPVNPGT